MNYYRKWPMEFIYSAEEAPKGHLPLTNALRGTQLLQAILEHPGARLCFALHSPGLRFPTYLCTIDFFGIVASCGGVSINYHLLKGAPVGR